MRIKALFLAMSLAFAAALPAVCRAGDLASDLVGKWQTRTQSGTEVFQFFNGGTATTFETDQPRSVTTWSYVVLDDGHIRLENQGPIREAKVLDVGIADGVLTLSQNGAIIGRYARMQ